MDIIGHVMTGEMGKMFWTQNLNCSGADTASCSGSVRSLVHSVGNSTSLRSRSGESRSNVTRSLVVDSDSFTFKLKDLNSNIHRVRAPVHDYSLFSSKLIEKLGSGAKNKLISFFYKDEDQDEIVIDSTEALQQAVDVALAAGLTALPVITKSLNNPKSEVPNQSFPLVPAGGSQMTSSINANAGVVPSHPASTPSSEASTVSVQKQPSVATAIPAPESNSSSSLPWILGGLLVVGCAAAAAVFLNSSEASGKPSKSGK